MPTITFHQEVRADGVVQLQIPLEMRGKRVQITVQEEKTHTPGKRSFESFAGAWVGEFPEIERDLPEERLTEEQLRSEHEAWIDATYGSIQDETFQRPEQGTWETREKIA